MVVPKRYLKTGEGSIATFDWTDIANGTGYSTYYGAKTASGANMTTVTAALYSERIHSTKTVALSGVIATPFNDPDAPNPNELDFDIQFNLPRQINGDVFINVPIGVHKNAAQGYRYGCSGAVLHVDTGGTETELGVGKSQQFAIVDLGGETDDISSDMGLIKINVDKTHFKKDEILRFRLTPRYRLSAGGAVDDNDCGVGHDPANRSDANYDDIGLNTSQQVISTGEPTQLSFHVPFVIDL